MSTTGEAINRPARPNTIAAESPSSDSYADAVESVDTAVPVSFADAIQSVDTAVPVLEHGREIRSRRRPVARFLKSVAAWFGKLFKRAGEEVVDMDEDMESQPDIPWHTARSSLDDIPSDYIQLQATSASFGIAVLAGHSSSGDLDKIGRVVAWLHDSLEEKSNSDHDGVNQGTPHEAKGPWKHQSGVPDAPSLPSPPSSLNDEGHDLVLTPVMPSTIMEQDDGFCLLNEAGVSHGSHRFRLKKIRNPFRIRERANEFGCRKGIISRMLCRGAAQQ